MDAKPEFGKNASNAEFVLMPFFESTPWFRRLSLSPYKSQLASTTQVKRVLFQILTLFGKLPKSANYQIRNQGTAPGRHVFHQAEAIYKPEQKAKPGSRRS